MAGTIVSDTLQDGAGNSTATTNAIQGSAKAWVRFAGGGSSATINASYNVSSVTRNATGFYTVAFTNALTDANYVMAFQNYGGNVIGSYDNTYTNATASSFGTRYYNGTNYDSPFCGVAVFR